MSMSDDSGEHALDVLIFAVRWGAVVAICGAVLLLALWISAVRFDACVRATGDSRYCTLEHPLGAHKHQP